MFTLLDYQHSIQLSQKIDSKVLITFNARNEHDRCKFAQDLEESIAEMDEMEQIRIEYELERQKMSKNARHMKGDRDMPDGGFDSASNRKHKSSSNSQLSSMQANKHSNSLLNINEQCKKPEFVKVCYS
jgi:PH domain